MAERESGSSLGRKDLGSVYSGPSMDLDYLNLKDLNLNDLNIELSSEAGPGSRTPLLSDGLCLEKTLTGDEIMGENPCIHLTLDEVRPLTRSVDDAFFNYYYHHGPFANATLRAPNWAEAHLLSFYSKILLVFDTSNREYDMLITNREHNVGGRRLFTYKLGGEGWKKFVEDHNLKAGDRICFYQLQDARVHFDYYYGINYVRNREPAAYA